jgi:hypothetical protein
MDEQPYITYVVEMLKDFRLSFIGKIAFHNKQNGVADAGYESTFIGSYKTHPSWFIAIGKS